MAGTTEHLAYLIGGQNSYNLRADEAWWRAKHVSHAHDDACILRRDIQDVDGITGSIQTCYTDTNGKKRNGKGRGSGISCNQDKYWSRCTTCKRRKFWVNCGKPDFATVVSLVGGEIAKQQNIFLSRQVMLSHAWLDRDCYKTNCTLKVWHVTINYVWQFLAQLNALGSGYLHC